MLSHSDAVPFDFDPEAFKVFDHSKVSLEPVQPIDGMYGRYGGRCLLLRNILTPGECRTLIREMSRGMEQVQYRQDYRRNDRAIFETPPFAELLWRRVEPFARNLSLCVDPNPGQQRLQCEEVASMPCPQPLRVCSGIEGIWHPRGLNECLRFCRYQPGGFFRPHCDACFERSEDERSFFTCMFYLDSDFVGGETRFLNLDGALTDENYLRPAAEDQVLASVRPEAGLCILFFQPGLLHEGLDVLTGTKHMLRTDVMFRRDPATKVERSPEEQEARRLAKEAEKLEAVGTAEACNEACRLYRRAFKLHPPLEREL